VKEVEGKKKEIAQTHGRLATMDEYAEWEGKNPDATVAQKRTQIQKIGAKNGVDETALDKIAKEQIAEKTRVRNLQHVQSGASDVLIDPDAEGGPKEVWMGAPKPKAEVDPVTGMIRQQHLDDAKSKRLSQETSDMDKKLAGEYSSEALNAIDSADDKKKLDTKNIDAVSGYLPSEKKEELDKIRTVASRLIEEDGYTAERAVREAKAAYKKRSEKSKHEAFTHNQPGHL
jgi:predicted house-cleaning noncanonical NTP pyrophosphatase (MazG superfamily)